MEYKVVITLDAEEDLDRFIRYLLFAKRNPQAATNVLNDFDETQQNLASIAGNLQPCDNPHLHALGYRKFHFQRHRYFMLYRIVDNLAIVDNIFHDLQDYENKIR